MHEGMHIAHTFTNTNVHNKFHVTTNKTYVMYIIFWYLVCIIDIYLAHTKQANIATDAHRNAICHLAIKKLVVETFLLNCVRILLPTTAVASQLVVINYCNGIFKTVDARE